MSSGPRESGEGQRMSGPVGNGWAGEETVHQRGPQVQRGRAPCVLPHIEEFRVEWHVAPVDGYGIMGLLS